MNDTATVCWRSECRNGCYYPDGCSESGEKCVGFADCPCRRCRATRVNVTALHPDHSPQNRSYCGVCRTWDRQKYDGRWA